VNHHRFALDCKRNNLCWTVRILLSREQNILLSHHLKICITLSVLVWLLILSKILNFIIIYDFIHPLFFSVYCFYHYWLSSSTIVAVIALFCWCAIKNLLIHSLLTVLSLSSYNVTFTDVLTVIAVLFGRIVLLHLFICKQHECNFMEKSQQHCTNWYIQCMIFVAVADTLFCLCSLAGEHVWRLPNERRSGGLYVAKFVHMFNFRAVLQWLGRCYGNLFYLLIRNICFSFFRQLLYESDVAVYSWTFATLALTGQDTAWMQNDMNTCIPNSIVLVNSPVKLIHVTKTVNHLCRSAVLKSRDISHA